MKQVEIISFIYLSIFIGGMLIIWPPDLAKTLSQNAARKRASIIYYAVGFLPYLALLSWFVLGWFVPRFGLSGWFGAYFVASIIGQVIALIIPETTGWKIRVHRLAAFTMAFCLLPMSVLIAVHPATAMPARLLAGAVSIYMVTAWATIIIPRRASNHYLIYQLAYVLSFLLLIFFTTYTT